MSTPYLFLLAYPLIAADDRPAGSVSKRVRVSIHLPRASPATSIGLTRATKVPQKPACAEMPQTGEERIKGKR